MCFRLPLVLLLASLVFAAAQEKPPGDGQPKEPPQPKADDPEWIPATKTAKRGLVEVRVVSVSLGKVPLISILDSDRESRSEEELISIKLEISNTSQTKKLNYRSWDGGRLAIERDYATLRDNFENTYKRISFGATTRPVGAIKGSESIYPEKSITDVLVFEIPVGRATHLDLELPAANYGDEGFIRIRIAAPFEKAKHEDMERPAWASPVKSSMNNDILLMLSSSMVKTGPVDLIDKEGKKAQSQEDAMTVVVLMANRTKGILAYSTWRDRSDRKSSHPAKLTDSKGRVYKQITFPEGMKVAYSTDLMKEPDLAPIPKSGLFDALVFEAPDPEATTFTLTLPGSAIGLNGEAVFEFPATAIRKVPRKPAQPEPKKDR